MTSSRYRDIRRANFECANELNALYENHSGGIGHKSFGKGSGVCLVEFIGTRFQNLAMLFLERASTTALFSVFKCFANTLI